MRYLVHIVGKEVWFLPPDEVRKKSLHMFFETLTILEAEAEVDKQRNAKKPRKKK